MAVMNPFDPGADSSPFAGVDPNTYTKVKNEWDAFLGDPQGRAALLSAGLAMMQPPSFGDTGASVIGRAIGAAGQSATANQAMDIKAQEADSKDVRRQAQSEIGQANAETRRLAAENRLQAAGNRAELQAERLANRTTLADYQNRIKLNNMYRQYVADVAKRNDPIALSMRGAGAKPEPVLTQEEWVRSSPLLKNMGLLPSSATSEDDNIPVPPVADTTSKPTLSAQDQQALVWANANPNDPRAAKIKQRLGM